MQILLANAKMMWPQSKVKRKPTSTPLFQSVANKLAAEMDQMDIDEFILSSMFVIKKLPSPLGEGLGVRPVHSKCRQFGQNLAVVLW